jgi:dihydroflavonol-4-reductase
MRVVVTGVLGFIGSHFAERALRHGHEVIGIWNSKGPAKNALRTQLLARGATLIEGDILNPETLRTPMQGAHCVCHFAAAFRESGVDDDYFLQTNVQGTSNVMIAAAEAKVRRLVMCSTAGIYGKCVPGTIDETSAVKPWNIYERSKTAAEQELRTRAPQLGLEYVILRPASVYGPRDERLLKLFRSAANGRFPLFGRGEGRRHMVYVTDLVEAFLKACLCDNAASQEMIIAGPSAVPLKELLQELAVVVERPTVGPRLPLKPMQLISAIVEDLSKLIKFNPPLYRRRMDFYLNDAAYNTRRAEAVLGWRPSVDLREGLSRTLQAYRERGVIPLASAVSQVLNGLAMYALTGVMEFADLTVPAAMVV